MRNIKYIGTKPESNAFFSETGIVWTPGKVDTVLDDTVAARMLKHPDVFQDEGDTSLGGVVTVDPVTGVAALNSDCSLMPSVIAHRGMGSLVAPDNAMSAYKAAVACRILNIEQDVHVLSDGSLACMHDATADATTTGTGAIAGLTGSQFKALVMDVPITLNAPSWQNENPPLFDEVVRELAPSGCIFWPEAKNTGSGAGIVSTLARHGIPKNRAVVQSFDFTQLAHAISYGYGAAYGVNPSTADFAALKSAGVTHIFWAAWTAPQVEAAHSAGIKAVVYTINRRVDWASHKANGVDLVFSDDPQWTSGTLVPMKLDPFSEKKWPSGMIGGYTTDRGEFANVSEWALKKATTPGFTAVLQGWACPIKNNPLADSFSIEFDLAIDAVTSADRWFSAFICAADDRTFLDASSSNEGYHILFRQNGRIDVYRKNGTVTTLIGGVSGTALTIGAKHRARITVTPTHIKAECPTVPGSLIELADAAYRGGFFHFTANNADIRVGSVVIS
jgi:glycerophosphoryl diester phosphodiesterase